eukprot:scaffold16457_cov117-Skeletonema_marinoi.AAC.1
MVRSVRLRCAADTRTMSYSGHMCQPPIRSHCGRSLAHEVDNCPTTIAEHRAFAFRKATTFLVSTASFFLTSNVAAISLRGVGEEVETEDDILTEEKAGTFLLALVDYEDRSIHSGPEETFNVMVDNSIFEIDDADDALKRMESGQAVTIPVGAVLSSKSGKVETNGAKIKAKKGDKKDDSGKKKKTKGLFKRNLEGRTEAQQRNVDQLRRHLVSLGDKSVVAVR